MDFFLLHHQYWKHSTSLARTSYLEKHESHGSHKILICHSDALFVKYVKTYIYQQFLHKKYSQAELDYNLIPPVIESYFILFYSLDGHDWQHFGTGADPTLVVYVCPSDPQTALACVMGQGLHFTMLAGPLQCFWAKLPFFCRRL